MSFECRVEATRHSKSSCDDGRRAAGVYATWACGCCARARAHRARCAAAIRARPARLMRRGDRDTGPARLFVPGFIFPCAQRCFKSRDSFLRAAALRRPRRFPATVVLGRPGPRGTVELTASRAAMAASSFSRSARSSVRIFSVFMMAPRAAILSGPEGSWQRVHARKGVPVRRRNAISAALKNAQS
jgi:hypothetical protein